MMNLDTIFRKLKLHLVENYNYEARVELPFRYLKQHFYSGYFQTYTSRDTSVTDPHASVHRTGVKVLGLKGYTETPTFVHFTQRYFKR